jgi:serine protease Do
MRKRTANRISALILLSAAILLALAACRSVVLRDEPVPLTEVTKEQIERNISDGDPFAAIQDLDLLKRDGSEIPALQLEVLHKNAAEALKTMFAESLEAENFGKALSIFRSATSLSGGEEYEGWTQANLINEVAKGLLRKGDTVAAYLTFSQALQSGEVPNEDAQIFLESAIAGAYTPLVEQLIADGVKPKDSEFATVSSIDPELLLKGTVTILVNKGIRLERGLGYPDSVIGSGFFIDSRGYIMTNYHIIESEVNPKYEGFSRLYIRTHDAENVKLPARVIGWDSVLDVALLKTELEPEYVFPVDPKIEYHPGDVIYAIGSPGGLRNTVTSGIVSATGRRFLQIGTTLQVDVPVNPGNSGGPLVNTQGELIGVVFAGIELFEGINFAIPANWVMNVVPRLFAGGAVVHSWLGLTVEETIKGLEVSYVLPGEAAGRAGIKQGDIITSIYRTEVSSVEEVHTITIELEPDTLVEVEWEREGQKYQGIVSLGRRPELPLDVARERDRSTNLLAPLFGMVIEEAGNYFWDKTYVIRRVYPGGVADETGLSVNDPLSIQGFEIDEENRAGYLQIVIKKKKAGFVERAIQLGAYLEVDNFI